MHIPDGFLDPYTIVITYVLMVMFVAVAFKNVRRLGEEGVGLVTTLAAFIFVAQMLAWPIPGGTSLHMVGGALVSVLLGPWVGVVVMFIVLLVQCLVFHDGGITALGANVINMGVVATFSSYLIYRVFKHLLSKAGVKVGVARFVSGFIAGWVSLGLAGTVCGVEIGVSGEVLGHAGYSLAISVPVMTVSHFILGIVEGLITGSIISYLGFKKVLQITAEVG